MVAVNPPCVLSSVRTVPSTSFGPVGPVEVTIVTGGGEGWTQSQPNFCPDSALCSALSMLEQQDEVGSGVRSAQHA